MTDKQEDAVDNGEAISDSAELDVLRRDMVLRYDELAMLQKEILNCDGRLQQELAKRRVVDAKLKAVYGSTSWRVTKPLRKVAQMMRRFL